MFLRHLHIILILLGVLTGTDGQNVSTIERISFLLERFCPGQGLCLSNRTVQQSAESDTTQCCSGCSCDDQCHPSMNCCFPALAKYSNVLETAESPIYHHSTCLYPFTNILDGVETSVTYSYRMISSAEGTGQSSSCGNQIVAPWGSLYPVYSKQKDLIFKNSACAQAYNVEDGILWNAYLICRQSTAGLLFQDASTFTVNKGMNISDDCKVYFQYPGDELLSHHCYIAEDFVETCPTSNFPVPSSVNMSADEIVSACTSGLLAPYRRMAMFANVFCFICNKRTSPVDKVCSRKDFVQQQSNSNTVGFVGLLSTNYLLPDKRANAKRSIRVACPRSCNEATTETCCREILCPSGKSLGSDGICYFSSSRWFNIEYEVLVNLTTTQNIDLTQIFTGSHKSEVLKRTWPNNWYIFAVSNELKDNGNMSRNIIVTIKIPYTEGSPDTLIHKIKKMMRRQWGLNVHDQFIPLNHSFSKLKFLYMFSPESDRIEETIVIAPNVTKKVTRPAVKALPFDSKNPARFVPFCISGLYYCEQVELLDSEYEMFDYFMYNKLTGHVMFNGEYAIVNRNGITVPRVCLDTSGLVASSGTRHAGTIIWMLLVAFVSSG